MGLLILIIFFLPCVLQVDLDERCFDYDLIFDEAYPLGVDVSNECRSNECIVLTGYVLVTGQDKNQWCLENTMSFMASTSCSKINNWSNYNNQQVKFQCSDSVTECSVAEPSCIPEWKKLCKLNNTFACPYHSSNPTETTSTSTEGNSVPTSDETINSTDEPTSLPTTTVEETETSTIISDCDQGLCPVGECFFDDHCYFVVPLFTPSVNKPLLALDVCGRNQSLARGLAVETSKENDFIQAFVRNNGYEGVFLTAGGRNFWSGWSSFVNRSLLVPFKGLLNNSYLTINFSANEFTWMGGYFYPPALYAICERELVWSVAFPWLRESCYKEYKNQQCNSSFCCASDEDNQIWFQCEGPHATVATKQCVGDSNNTAKWICLNGSFTAEAPDNSQCRCDSPCVNEFEGTQFSACPLKYAYADCPDNGKGYMRWRCLTNGTFEGNFPSMDLCCGNDEIYNRQDPFLNVWIACPNTTVTRFVECWDQVSHFGAPLRYQQASVNWTCGPSGFVGITPDYSGCNICNETCDAVDDRGETWSACIGTLAQNPCPDGMKGNVFWSCGNSSNFVNDTPDYSECYSGWINDVEDMISNNDEAIVIMSKIHEELKMDLSGTGLKKILSVTSAVIDLFVSQNRRNGSIEIYENFTTTYVDVLDDVTRNASSWIQLSDIQKHYHMEETISMTNRIAFALKEVAEDAVTDYTNFFQSKHTVLSLWMAYSRNLTQVTFPYEASKNTCSVNFYGIESAPDNALFTAVGIVFPHLVSVAAFPVRMGSIIINSAVLSMTVADVSSDEPVQQKTVSMLASFKHSTKARYPDKKLIRRRLYDGEKPSPIIGASRCFFYDTQQYPNAWSSSGCFVASSSAEETVCRCHHLTSFSVLVDVHDYVRDPAMEAFSLACSTLSIIGLILSLIVFKVVKMRRLKLDSDRTIIDVNCCLCLLVSHLMIVTVLDKKFFYISDKMCSVVAGILHYFLTAAFFWMSVEAYHLYHLIVLVFTREGSYISHYFIIGYILPFIPIMLTELASQVLQKPAYGRDEICWLETDFIWSFNGPVFLLTGGNLVVIIIAMRAAVTKKESNSFKKWWVWCKGLAFLCTLLGVTWLVALVYIEADLSPIIEYLFILLNGLQGVYIFIFQCVLNNQVRPMLVQFFMRRSRKPHHSSFSRISQKATAISSEVDNSAKTGISTVDLSTDVKIVQCPPIQPGQWMYRTNTPRRQWINSDIAPCDDMVRQLQRRIIRNSDSNKV